MKLNAINKIDENKGDYIILGDWRSEGLSVIHQCVELEEAIQHCLRDHGCPVSLVRLVEVYIQED